MKLKIGRWGNGVEIYAKFTKEEDTIIYEGWKDNEMLFSQSTSFSELVMFNKMYEVMLLLGIF